MRGDEGIAPYEGIYKHYDKLQSIPLPNSGRICSQNFSILSIAIIFRIRYNRMDNRISIR